MQSGRCSFPLQLPVYSKKELDLHLAEHPVCRLCNRWFYDTEDLRKHLYVAHEYCYICRDNFLGPNALAEHLRWKIIPCLSLPCEICNLLVVPRRCAALYASSAVWLSVSLMASHTRLLYSGCFAGMHIGCAQSFSARRPCWLLGMRRSL